MRCGALALAAVLAVGAVAGAPPPARANVFCPATVAAVENLAIVGRPNTYGVLLDLDPGDTASLRLRVDSLTTRFAVDFNDLEPIGAGTVRIRRYFALPQAERVVAAWIESTGTGAETRAECPLTSPYHVDAPPPLDPRVARTLEADRRLLRDSFSTKSTIAFTRSFGAAETRACTQPYAPPRAILSAPPDLPAAARAIHASGTVVVRIDLDETSTVVGGAVVRSSGFAPLDRAALDAAQKSSYRTETFACRSIASSYQFTVTFNSGS